MAHKLFPYELSQEADKDLDEIFEYTLEQFGFQQAVKYLLAFEELFENIDKNQHVMRSIFVRKMSRFCSGFVQVLFRFCSGFVQKNR